MLEKYNIDGLIDDDDEDFEEVDISKSIPKNNNWNIKDIEKLKEQTNELLDNQWKVTRNKQLLRKMLELEQPSITPKMVDFLLQDNVTETLVKFITQNGHSGPRPGPNDEQDENMKLAYRAVLLLSPEIIPDPLNAVLLKKAGVIANTLFDIFLDDSAGSFYHAYRLFECLLRCYPCETLDGIYSDNLLGEKFTNLLKYIGFSPVCELIVMIVAFTPVPRNTPLFNVSSKSRWAFLESLNQWNIMVNVAKIVVDPENCCSNAPYVTKDQHSAAAAQLLQDLIEKVSLEDTGDLLLLPIGQNETLIDNLIEGLIDPNIDTLFRSNAAKLLSFLLRRAAESDIMYFIPTNSSSPPQPTFIPNRLFALRENIVTYIHNHFDKLANSVLEFDKYFQEFEPTKYSSYEVKKPFGALRYLIIEVIVLTVESVETAASLIPVELWKSLISLVIQYAYNNVYHALFYRLVFAVLRQGQEEPQKNLFQKSKFATFLVDNFIPYYVSPDNVIHISEPVSKNISDYELKMRRIAARGLIMNCANAIRLQISTQAPNSFLLSFLSSHTKWNEFLPLLTAATDAQVKFGMGIKVSIIEAKPGVGPNGMSMFISEMKPADATDHNIRFAKSLGFYEEASWSLETPFPPPGIENRNVDEIINYENHLIEETERLSYLADDQEIQPPNPPSL